MRKWTKALRTKLQSGQVTEADIEMPTFEPVPVYERPQLTFAEYLAAEDYVHLGRPMVRERTWISWIHHKRISIHKRSRVHGLMLDCCVDR
jgi:hypothetical protein